MNISAVLNTTVKRDLVISAGNEFTLNLAVYPADDQQQIASDMTGSVVTLYVYYSASNYVTDYGYTLESDSPIFTIEGTEGTNTTFDFLSAHTSTLKGRYLLKIKRLSAGKTATLIDGTLTVK